MGKFKLIEIHPGYVGGAPKIKYRRLNVYNVVSGLLYDELVSYLEGFNLSIIEVEQAINYCRTLQCIQDKPELYCAGCVLRGKQELAEENKIFYEEAELEEIKLDNGDVIVKSPDGNIFLGNLEEYKESIQGKPGWIIAQSMYDKYNHLFNS